jgi:hypothetical protein
MMGAASPPPAAAIETAPKPAKEGMSKYERLAKKLADDEAKKADGRARGASFANKNPLYIKVFDIFSFFFTEPSAGDGAS